MINIVLDFNAPDQDSSEDDFFFTPVISYEYRSLPDSDFVTGEFVVNELLHSRRQTHTIYFIVNNVYQIKNISAKIRTDYITTELENVEYIITSHSNLLILFFKNNNNSDVSSNNNFALTNTVNQINNMNIYNDPFNNNNLNYYIMSKYRLSGGDGKMIINNNIISADSVDIDNTLVEQFDNTNIPNYFYTNYDFNNEMEFVQYLTFINIKVPEFYYLEYIFASSLWTVFYRIYDNLYKFHSIVETSVNDSHKVDLFFPCFNTDNSTTVVGEFNFYFLFNVFRTTYIPESSSPTNNYINFRSVSDNVTQSTVLPSNMSQCINNSMSFAYFKVENLGIGFYDFTQIQPLSYYIRSNTTISFNSNINPSVLSFDSTTNVFTLNGVFAVFATAEIFQLYNDYDALINNGYSLVIKMGFSSSGPFFFTKIASLFETSNTGYSFVMSDFSMINALEGITSELYINNITMNNDPLIMNEICIENLELFFLQLS